MPPVVDNFGRTEIPPFDGCLVAVVPHLLARTSDQWLTAGLWWVVVIWLGAFGACIGSFLTVVWDRLGTGEGIVFPCSRCPECDHDLRWYHNLPIFGWIILRGRCYDCGARIPIKHPLVEAFFALVFILIGLATPWL